MNLNIILLQETHSQDNTIKYMGRQLECEFSSSHGNGNARGVCILIQNLEYTLLDKTIDSNGRYNVLTISLENLVYVVCNIYGHNNDKVEYLKDICQ